MTTTAAAAVRTLQFDTAHSEVAFQVRHLLTRVRGRFADFAGTIQLDEAAPERSSVSLTIQAASIDTNQSQRDEHLRSADFFETETHPTLTFTSASVTRTSADTFAVAGDLTIRGVTKPVTVTVSYVGIAKDPWGNAKYGFEAEATIDRKDFGLNWNAALETGGFLVGDEVKISGSIQAA
jgi:polyisoprenoid-binding protein YceI